MLRCALSSHACDFSKNSNLDGSSTVFEIRTFHLAGYFSGKAEEPLNQYKRFENQLWI